MIMGVWYGHSFIVATGMEMFDELFSITRRNHIILLVVQEKRRRPAFFGHGQ